MPSFDVVSEINESEVRNAVDQANREISTRYDFKGSDARIEQNACELILFGDSDFQLEQIKDILVGKLSKRGVDIRCMDWNKAEKISGNKLKQLVTLKKGIDSILSKTIVKLVKDSKMKIQASIQGETVRITGAKKDVLQESMQLIRSSVKDFPIQFNNFRD
jgi:uncharacterized protein YajQ (UPF0234 family)